MWRWRENVLGEKNWNVGALWEVETQGTENSQTATNVTLTKTLRNGGYGI